MKRTRGCFLRMTLIMLSILFTCSMIELAARVYIRLRYDAIDAWEFRYSQPAPYQRSDYFAAEFVTESMYQSASWSDTGGSFVLPVDTEGTWYHVRNQRRVTTDQPETYQHTLYVFGGSTVYGSDVPDSYTIPSFLQREMNTAYPGLYRVENMGVITLTSTQEVARLRTIDLRRGDVVMMYHGVNDASLGIYFRRPASEMVDTMGAAYDRFTASQRTRFDLWQGFRPTLSSAALFLYPFSLAAPEHLSDPAALAHDRSELAAQYTRNLTDAQRYVDAHGATLLVFLQPNLFTKAAWTDYERRLAGNPYIVFPGTEVMLIEGYAALREAEHPVRWIDISDVFDGHTGEVYVDYCHVAEEGNRLIAARISRELVKAGE